MKSTRMMAVVIVMASLGIFGVLGGRPVTAQNTGQAKYNVRVPNGLAFSEFRGYEGWQTVSISHNEKVRAPAPHRGHLRLSLTCVGGVRARASPVRDLARDQHGLRGHRCGADDDVRPVLRRDRERVGVTLRGEAHHAQIREHQEIPSFDVAMVLQTLVNPTRRPSQSSDSRSMKPMPARPVDSVRSGHSALDRL